MVRSWIRRSVVATAFAAALSAALAAVTTPSITFTDTSLSNGLRVVIAEDHVAPVFSVAISYNVGSRDERKGRTGFAHLFEHMMFKGSANVGTGEHFYTIFSNGGNMNGTTNKERTIYYETMPANQLDAALFLEADRMRSLAIVKDNLDNQRNAVQEERRQNYDNQPYGRVNEILDDLAYDNVAYKHSTIGSMEDLTAASVEDVAAFFKTYYAPNNAVLVIVGDVKTPTALARVRNYFEAIPRQEAPPPVDVAQPAQNGERRRTVEDGLARLPRVDIGYRIPSSISPEDDALQVLQSILGGGRSSRFYETVVRDKQLAVNFITYAVDSRGPRLFRISATPANGKAPADVEAAFYAEIERVKNGPIADWELEKARNAARRDFVGELDNSLSRARDLAEYTLYFKDPGRINAQYDRLTKITAADVQRAARQYLTVENRTVVITQPRPAQGGGR